MRRRPKPAAPAAPPQPVAREEFQVTWTEDGEPGAHARVTFRDPLREPWQIALHCNLYARGCLMVSVSATEARAVFPGQDPQSQNTGCWRAAAEDMIARLVADAAKSAPPSALGYPTK